MGDVMYAYDLRRSPLMLLHVRRWMSGVNAWTRRAVSTRAFAARWTTISPPWTAWKQRRVHEGERRARLQCNAVGVGAAISLALSVSRWIRRLRKCNSQLKTLKNIAVKTDSLAIKVFQLAVSL
jgi:hypothetical protein